MLSLPPSERARAAAEKETENACGHGLLYYHNKQLRGEGERETFLARSLSLSLSPLSPYAPLKA